MLNKFIDYLRCEKRYSERTVSIYSEAIGQFLANAAIESNDVEALAGVQSQQVRSWIADLLKSNESTRTINLKLTAINRFFKFLLKEEVLLKNPMQYIQRPKMSKRLPEFFEAAAINEVLNTCVAAGDYLSVRDTVMLEVLYATGIRRAELIRLAPGDIYFSEKVIRVTGKGDKQREVPIPDSLINRLQHFISARQEHFPALTATDKLFVSATGKPLYPYAVNRAVHRRLDNREGFTGKKSPHVLRHSLATHLLNNGADIMSIKETLGHASLAATQVYTHNSFKKLKNVYRKAHPRA